MANKVRRLGMIGIVIAIYLMLTTAKPDIIIHNKAIGLKNTVSGDLEIYANKISDFTLKHWANWYGQESASLGSADKDFIYISKYGQTIGVNFTNKNCKKVDIQINFVEESKCLGSLKTINALKLKEPVLLICNKKKCKLM